MTRARFERRSFLARAAGAAGAATLAGCGGPEPEADDEPVDGGGGAGDDPAEADRPQGPQESGDHTLIRLVAQDNVWVGQGPESTSEEENPTLRLQNDVEYEIVWENRDGEEHDLVIEDSDGEEVASTESAANTGERARSSSPPTNSSRCITARTTPSRCEAT